MAINPRQAPHQGNPVASWLEMEHTTRFNFNRRDSG